MSRRCSGSPLPTCCGQAARTGWEQVGKHDVQQWMVWLLGRYSAAYASNQYRGPAAVLQVAGSRGGDLADPMTGLRPPHVPGRPVPVFAAADLSALERACAGRWFQQRRDAAMIAVFAATGIRLSELAGLRYDPGDPQRSDIDLGSGRSPSTARAARPGWSRSATTRPAPSTGTSAFGPGMPRRTAPQLWLGVNNRGPMTASGIYQVIARRGRQCGVAVFPHRFRHHFSHTWLDRGGAEGDLMELNGWTSPQMLRRYGASARSARARRSYDRIMTDRP